MALPSARGWEDLETLAPALTVAVGLSQAILAVSLKSCSPSTLPECGVSGQIFPASVAPHYWSLHFQHLGAAYGAYVAIIYLCLGKAWCGLCNAEFPSLDGCFLDVSAQCFQSFSVSCSKDLIHCCVMP